VNNGLKRVTTILFFLVEVFSSSTALAHDEALVQIQNRWLVLLRLWWPAILIAASALMSFAVDFKTLISWWNRKNIVRQAVLICWAALILFMTLGFTRVWFHPIVLPTLVFAAVGTVVMFRILSEGEVQSSKQP
jgi:uncharacterized membrane protein YfcA